MLLIISSKDIILLLYIWVPKQHFAIVLMRLTKKIMVLVDQNIFSIYLIVLAPWMDEMYYCLWLFSSRLNQGPSGEIDFDIGFSDCTKIMWNSI